MRIDAATRHVYVVLIWYVPSRQSDGKKSAITQRRITETNILRHAKCERLEVSHISYARTPQKLLTHKHIATKSAAEQDNSESSAGLVTRASMCNSHRVVEKGVPHMKST